MMATRELAIIQRRDAEFELIVPAEHEDGNGHVNVLRYAEFHDRAVDSMFQRLGYPRPDRRDGVFNIQSRTLHVDEVLVGHRVSAQVVLMDFDGRLFQVAGHLVNVTTGAVATSFEALLGNVSLETRRLCPAPAEVAEAANAEVAAGRAAGWEALELPPIRIRRDGPLALAPSESLSTIRATKERLT